MKLKIIGNKKDSMVTAIPGKREEIFMMIAGFALLIFFIALYVLNEYNRKPVNVSYVKPDFEVTDSALIAEFENSEKLAMKKYSGKIILIKGIIRKIAKNGSTYTINLGNPLSGSSVHCLVDSAQDAGNWSEGRYIACKGVFVDFNRDELLGSDIILNRCILNYK